MKRIKLVFDVKGRGYYFCLNDLLSNLKSLRLINDRQVWNVKRHVFKRIVESYNKEFTSSGGACGILILEFQTIYMGRFTPWDIEAALPKKALESIYYFKFVSQVDMSDYYHLHSDFANSLFEFEEFKKPFSNAPLAVK